MNRDERRGHVGRSRRKRGFTLVELMIVIAIIFTLAALLMTAMEAARRTAKNSRTNAILDTLATACERYWSQYHDYPYPNPDYVGGGIPGQTLGNNGTFRGLYYVGGAWTEEGYNVALVYILSLPQTPEPLINVQQDWFKVVMTHGNPPQPVTGPDGIRKLFKVVDGFGNVIKVARMDQDSAGNKTALDPTTITFSQNNSYIWFMSYGADGKLGTYDWDKNAPIDADAKDNLSRYVRR
jgi:prepilin-type N-terminal cleavage/methylation domain-containing protein